MAVERHRHHQRGHRRVRDGVHDVAVRGAEQAVAGRDERVAAGPHGHRGEAERDGQRQARNR